MAPQQHTPAGGQPQASSFNNLGLSQTALDAVADMGYDTPTPVQKQAIPLVLEGRDVMAAAQTGTGKTAAFLLPCLDRLERMRGNAGPSMLVVTPTRELAQQIEEVAETVCRHTGHRTTTVVGGVSYEPQYRALRKGCDLLVATPGRLVDLIEQGEAHLGDVRVLVLDEADRMLDMGFLPQMRRIVGQLPAKRQTLLFSATLDEHVLDNTRDLVSNPVRVEIAHKGTAAETIDQYALPVSLEVKNGLLPKVLQHEGAERVIVFCRAKHRADGVCRRLRRAGIRCAPIHGNRSQNQRERALEGFRNGEIDVLVATDVLARGIDIPQVAYVVNFDVPSDPEDYIHRIGRTGRAGEAGWALTFVTHDDYLDLRDIEALMGKVVPTWPKAEAFELGEEPPVLDSSRSPKDKLPGKKTRKRMKEAAAAERAKKAEENEDAKPNEKRTRRKRTPGSGSSLRAQENLQKEQDRPQKSEGQKKDGRGGRGKKRGVKGSQNVNPPSSVDMSGAGVTWGVRQRKGDGRKQIALDDLKAELSDLNATERKGAGFAARPAEVRRNWRDIAAEIAGMTSAPMPEAEEDGGAEKNEPKPAAKKRRRRRKPGGARKPEDAKPAAKTREAGGVSSVEPSAKPRRRRRRHAGGESSGAQGA